MYKLHRKAAWVANWRVLLILPCQNEFWKRMSLFLNTDDQCAMYRLISTEAAIKGAMMSLWIVFFVTLTYTWVATIDVETAFVASLFVLFLLSFASTYVWISYKDAMSKRLKNHIV